MTDIIDKSQFLRQIAKLAIAVQKYQAQQEPCKKFHGIVKVKMACFGSRPGAQELAEQNEQRYDCQSSKHNPCGLSRLDSDNTR